MKRQVLPVLSILLLISILAISPSKCQVVLPLSGQGEPPYRDGQNVSSQIRMNVTLVKLLDVHERDYTFSAVLNFNMEWDDPRADNAWTASEEKKKVAVQLEQCKQEQWMPRRVNASNSTHPTKDCSHLEHENGACKRQCFTFGDREKTRDGSTGRCCDGLWIPDIALRNLVAMPPDRAVHERISPVKVVHPDKKSEPPIIVGSRRNVRVHGTFSARLNFRRYPYDRQHLFIVVHPDHSRSIQFKENGSALDGYTIVPGATFHRADIDVDDHMTMVRYNSDTLPGWEIHNVSFSCHMYNDSMDSAGGFLYGEQLQGSHAPAEREIYSRGYKEDLSRDTEENRYQFCVVAIEVSRMASTALVTSILPVAFISLLSFVVFFIAPDKLEVRISTEITLFLALTTVQFVFREQFPLTSYVTKLDIFLTMAYTLLIVLVLETLVVCFISQWQDHKEKMGRMSLFTIPENSQTVAPYPPVSPRKLGSQRGVAIWKSISTTLSNDRQKAYRVACQIDMIAGIVLLISYVVCVIAIVFC